MVILMISIQLNIEQIFMDVAEKTTENERDVKKFTRPPLSLVTSFKMEIKELTNLTM